MRIHLGLVTATPSVERKLRSKHRGLTLADVRAAIQWPAVCASAWDDHPEYGRRLMAIGNDGRGEIVCYLTPIPYWDEDADTWALRTAWRL